ncbi:MAG: hypothetical protein LAO24_16535 [Acidobacteriia bacterium]|nr:hypothetical protein [Terriglobia bacterium]
MRIYVCVGLLALVVGSCAAQETNFAVGPQYLMTSGSPLFARPIATPSLSFETPLPEAVTSEPAAEPVSGFQLEAISAAMEEQRQMALMAIYYGAPTVNVIEISFREPAGEESTRPALPFSITESGVTALTDAETLRRRGYGVTLAEAAQQWRARRSVAPHVFTNSDLENLQDKK